MKKSEKLELVIFKKLGRLFKDRCWLIVLLFSAVIIFVLEIIQPNFFLWDDNATYFIPNYIFNFENVIGRWTIPHINFHQYLGTPYLAQGQTGIFYPFVYLSLWLSKILFGELFRAIEILVFVHFVASGLGMYWLLRRLRVSEAVGVVFSVLWITSPFLILNAKSWVFISYVACYLPFLMLSLIRLIDNPSWRSSWIFILVRFLFFLQGYVHYFIIYLILELLFLASFIFKKNRKEIKKIIFFYVFSFLNLFFITAPLLFSMFYAMRISYDRVQAIPKDGLLHNSLEWKDFFLAQFFQFKEDVISKSNSAMFYFGGMIYSFFIFEYIRVHKLFRMRVVQLFGFAILALVFSTASYGIFSDVPLLNVLRWPFKHFIFFLFFFNLGLAPVINKLILSSGKGFRSIYFLLLLLGICGNLLVTIRNAGNDNLLGPYRINSPYEFKLDGQIDSQSGRTFTYKVNDTENFNKVSNYLTHNFATLFGFYHFGGYDPIISYLNNTLSLGLNYWASYEETMTQETLDHLSRWGVRYVLAEDTQTNKEELEEFEQLIMRFEGENILLYENPGALPLVYWEDETTEKLRFEFRTNEIEVWTEPVENERTMVISVAPFLEYDYLLNGKLISSIPPEKGQVRLPIKSGISSVVLRYVNYPFRYGLIVLIVYFLLIFPLGWIFFRKRIKNWLS